MTSETESACSLAQTMDPTKEVISGATSSVPKKTLTKSNSAKASPSSRTSASSITQSSATGRKLARTNTYGKSSEEFGEDVIRDLKKNITFLHEHNLALKANLRRSEDDNSRKDKLLKLRESTKNGNDKSATILNSAMTQLKRKIHQLEQTLREKETVIRQLQNDARIAAQSASWSNMRKETAVKSPSRSSGPNSSPNRVSHSSLQAENEKLKQQLRRALAVEESNITEYSDLGTDELIAFIVRLNQDIGKLEMNRKSSEPVDESTVFELQAEVEKLNQELKRLKEDRQAYFEDCESKSGEIKALRQKIDKLHKELSNTQETVRKPPSPNFKRTSGLVTSPTISPPQPQPKIRTTKVERSPETKSSTAGTSASSRVIKLTPPSQSTKKSETRRTVTAVTKVTTVSPVKIKATKVKVEEKKRVMELANKERSVDSKKKLLERSKPQEPRVEEPIPEPIGPQEPHVEEPIPEPMSPQEPHVEEPIPEPTSVQELGKSEPEKPSTDDKISEEAKTEINTEDQVNEKHEEFRQNIAAKKIQREWRKHYTEKQQVHSSSQDDDLAPVTEKEADIEGFKQNRAAKTIQKQWRVFHEKSVKVNDGGEAILTTTTIEGEENHLTSGDKESESGLTSGGNDKQQLDDGDEIPFIVPEVFREQELEEKINGEQEHD